MKTIYKIFAALMIMALCVPFLPASKATATGNAIYDSIPSPLPRNLPSQPYEAQQAAEVGDHVSFAGANRSLSSVTVTMSTWARHSEYPSLPDSGWTHPLTFNLYQVDKSGPAPKPGALIATLTQVMNMPWRPESDPTCPNTGYGEGFGWRASNGICYNGFAFNVTFDFSSLNVTLPDEVIYGLAYNTQSYGYQPIGVGGPYNSLNFALNNLSMPSVGLDVNPDDVFWNTKTANWYSDGGAGGVGVFRRDTGWTPYIPAVRFEVAAASLETKTDKALFCTGEMSTVKIDLNNIASLYGYQFEVNYDQSLVSASGAFVNSFFDTTGGSIPWNAACANGKCQFSVSRLDPQAAVSGSGTVAEITFTGLHGGEFDVTVSNDILSDRDANVLGHTAAAPLHLMVCGFASASGVVSLQGRATPTNAGTITLTDGIFGPYTTNFDPATGAWSISNIKVLPGGTSYKFDAAHGLYLGAQLTKSLVPGDAYAAPAVKLKGGDADNSGKIDVTDLGCIGGAFGGPAAACGPGSTDINADSVTNILDLVLAGGNYSLVAPQPWP